MVFKIYLSLKRSGVLTDKASRNKYVLMVLFWPLHINPFKFLAQKIFQGYGNKGHQYFGWTGLRNFAYDIIKGRDRYKHYFRYSFDAELEELPLSQVIDSCRAKIIIAKDNGKYLVRFHINDPKHTTLNVSRYDLDDCKAMDIKNLTKELGLLKLKQEDIKHIIQTITNKKETNNVINKS